MKEYKKRELYLHKIRPYIGKDIIKVLVWQRRVGKSYILFQLMDEIQVKWNVSSENILYINKELSDFDTLRNNTDLLEYIHIHLPKNDTLKYIFIDEIQDIEYFEKALRDLQARGWYDIYISGSNAHMLSGEIASYLTGRYIEFEIYPLVYSEFLDFHELPASKESFFFYLQFGGLPYLRHLKLEQEVVFGYLQSVYSTILLKDIVKRYAIRNIDFLERLVEFLADNVWSLVTASNISKYLKSQKIDMNTNVVLEYLHHSSSVFLVNKVKRQEIVGKKIFESNDKYFFSDIGMRNAILGWYTQADIAKVLENIVYLHFKSLGYSVFVWKNKTKEIDFVVQKGSDKKYIQVAYLIPDDTTREREFWNLLEIPDNYEKIVLSLDEYIAGDYKGIKHYNIREYFLA